MAGVVDGEFRRGWRVLLTACLGLAFSLVTVPYYSLSQFIAPLQAEFGWSPAQIGIAATILTVSLFLTGPHMGRLVDRVGVRRLLLPSTVLVALCMATLTLIRGSVWSLYAGYVLISLAGAATTHVAYSRVITTWFDRSRGLALGITMAGAGVTAFIMPLLLSRVIGEYGWRAGILTCAIVMLLPLPLLYRYLHERERSPDHGSGGAGPVAAGGGMSTREALRSRRFWTMVAATALFSPAIQVAVIHMMPLLGTLGLTPAAAAKTASLLGLGIIIGRFLSGTLLDRLPGPVVGFTLFMIPVAGYLILYAQNGALAPLAVTLVGVSIGVEGDILAYFTARYFGLRSYAEIFGWVFGVMCITGAAGPLLVLAMPADQGYGPLLLMFSGMVVVSAALLATMGRYPDFAREAGR